MNFIYFILGVIVLVISQPVVKAMNDNPIVAFLMGIVGAIFLIIWKEAK